MFSDLVLFASSQIPFGLQVVFLLELIHCEVTAEHSVIIQAGR